MEFLWVLNRLMVESAGGKADNCAGEKTERGLVGD